ncbi:LuxR C-terminal-related transcriptional regulator [Pseudomonas sp. PD9R]|uniref:LuxR C-terminal-related transcriptional regulator n=1 Tax=Pseudomonas sp. PD9R TaxID=2853534 RepID=UPI001C490321|nr:LuxR C-terminal-related transcriptional regulator [Pseudomonas sp. PD9R]MBV6822078.1 LuxR C-terminal-related transcriptional regulator [Pseudomonas sp. PD9R]
MFVPRPHLCDVLKREQRRLHLLCAPAGFGKTALLREYLKGVATPGRVVWLSLGGRLQTLDSLTGMLAGELDLALDTAADALLGYFSSRDGVTDLSPSQASQLPQGNAIECGSWLASDEALAGSENLTIRVVFDDLPAAMPADLNQWFDQLLALQNPNLQVLVTCRQRPDWNLPHLVLTGELLELDARQLALRPDEFESLVSLQVPEIDTVSREKLWHQTGGWCAGVRLLPCALLDPYLEREWLSRLSDGQQEMLNGLAHLSKASVDLCDQLWEGQQGAHVFQSLLDSQAFLFPIDNQPGWFRLLPAVAQALQSRLSGAPLNRLRLRACQLLSVLGKVDDAVEQALSADQPEMAATYMERLWLSWILSERHLGRFMDWRERIEPQLLQSSPRLIYLSGRALLFSGRLSEAEECLHRLGHFLPLPDPQRSRRLLANWQGLYGTLQALRGNTEQARLHCHASLRHLTAQDWLSVLLCHCTLARIAMKTGELTEAQVLLEHSLELARRQGSRDAEALVNTDRVRLLMLQGHLGMAQSLLRSELAQLTGSRTQPYPLLGRLMFLQGELLLQQGHTVEAEQVVQGGLLQVRDCCAPFVLDAYLLLSEIASRNDDIEQAHLLLYEAERRMHWGKIDSVCYQRPIALQKARILDRERGADSDKPSVACVTSVPDYQDGLTTREVSVLKLLAEGMSVREVGHRLFISVNTVKTHAKNINVKLGACRRTQAINSAKAMGILA